MLHWSSCNRLIIFQIYHLLGCCRSGSWKSHQTLNRISADMFFIILIIIIEDLPFTEHSPVAVYLNFHRFVDVEKLWKFSSLRKFSLHVVYIFELVWNSLAMFWYSDQRLSRNGTSLLNCMLCCLLAFKFACLMYSCVYVLCVFACLRARFLSVLACFMSLRAHISYMLAVLQHLTRLPAWHRRLSYLRYIRKVKFQKLFYKNLGFIQRCIWNILENLWWSLFAKKVNVQKPRPKAPSHMFFWVINTSLVLLNWTHFLFIPILSLLIPI